MNVADAVGDPPEQGPGHRWRLRSGRPGCRRRPSTWRSPGCGGRGLCRIVLRGSGRILRPTARGWSRAGRGDANQPAIPRRACPSRPICGGGFPQCHRERPIAACMRPPPETTYVQVNRIAGLDQRCVVPRDIGGHDQVMPPSADAIQIERFLRLVGQRIEQLRRYLVCILNCQRKHHAGAESLVRTDQGGLLEIVDQVEGLAVQAQVSRPGRRQRFSTGRSLRGKASAT